MGGDEQVEAEATVVGMNGEELGEAQQRKVDVEELGEAQQRG